MKVKLDEIAVVKTAINVATIIQVPDPPTSLVLGDSSGFKVEYLDQAITIKPLHGSAKTNLYIYTELRRFDVSLVSVPESRADYVVYLKQFQELKKDSSSVRWKVFERKINQEGISFRTKRIGQIDNIGLIEFEVSSSSRAKIDPGIFWLMHRGSTYEIEKLILSNVEIGPNRVAAGLISLRFGKLKHNDQLVLEVRQKTMTKLVLPKIEDWK